MNSEEEDALLLILLRRRRHQRYRRKRNYWVNPIIENRNQSQFRLLYGSLRNSDDKFFDYFHMSVNTFDYLLNLLKDSIKRNDTIMRKSVPAEERLAMTIRYLATGYTFKEIHYTFRCGATTASKIIKDVCQEIWLKLQPIHLPKPNKDMWKDIAQHFKSKANFPNCVGAVDGKHIRIIHPPDSGSIYRNCKNSIVLLTVCDSNYSFIYVDIGAYGKTSNSTIWKDCELYKLMKRNELDLPEPQPISTEGSPLPYTFIGDEAFGLSEHMLRPYGGKQMPDNKRIFNYRLSRARRYVESSLGILANKWRILHRPLNVSVEFATDIVKACVVLHNIVRNRDGFNFEDTLITPNLMRLENDVDFRVSRTLNAVREQYTDYFLSSEGELHWQYKHI